MVKEDQELQKLYEAATQMERDGMEFYQKASEMTDNPLGKRMFQSFAEDEKHHLAALKRIFGKEPPPPGGEMESSSSPKERMRTIFSELKGSLNERVRATTDEISALKFALENEVKAYRFYSEAAERVDDSKLKGVLEALAREESQHQFILDNTYSFLEETGNWFLWEESALLDGG